MKKILPFFLFFFFFTAPVLADGFTVSGDVSQNNFYSTISYTLDDVLPEKIVTDTGVVTYNPSDIFASSTNALLHTDVSQLFQDSIRRRINSNGTYIALPPGSTVDVIYHYWNNSTHPIDIEEIKIAYTRGHISFIGYLTEFGSFNSEEYILNPVILNYFGKSFSRKGVFRKYPGLRDISSESKGSLVVDSFRIKLPLEISNPVAERIENGVKVTVLIKNVTNGVLNNVSFEHGDFKDVFTLQPNQEKGLEYILFGDFYDGNLGSFVLKDGNISRKCTVLGNNWYDNFSPESISVFSKRSDGGWVSGGSMGPSQESFCMQRNPYTFTSNNIETEKIGNEVVIADEQAEPVTQQLIDEDSVLGVESTIVQLPNTGLVDSTILASGVMLLVVDVFLWYSVLRRDKYESKYLLTKLCTKSRKNSLKRGL